MQRIRLDGLSSRASYNHHIAELLPLPPPKPGRLAIQVLSSGEALSVPESSCLSVPPPPIPGHEVLSHECHANEATLRHHASHVIERAAAASAQTAPVELADHVLSFLKVRPVSMGSVRATAASSSGQDVERCAPDFSLDPARDNWWISGHESMPRGRGAEWVEYDLGDDNAVVSILHLTIPPLPSGPLSVRHFHLEACADPPLLGSSASSGSGQEMSAPQRDWRRASADLTTLDVAGSQTFALHPPIERLRYVRIVCKVNAAAAELDEAHAAGTVNTSSAFMASDMVPSSVGFFSIAFA